MAGHPQVHRICPLLMAALGLGSPLRALTAESYHASDQTMAGTTVVLTGHDLSIESSSPSRAMAPRCSSPRRRGRRRPIRSA